MDTAANHVSSEDLERGLADVLASPSDGGRVEAIFVRPQEGERQSVPVAQITPTGGIEGDRWAHDHWQKLPNGLPDPRSQVSLMNARILRLIAGAKDAMCLAGDNLIVDLDLSTENLPAGSHLQIGDQVVLELTDQPHTGCGKFSHRYGASAFAFVNGSHGKLHNLRGRYARILQGGTIRAGDSLQRG